MISYSTYFKLFLIVQTPNIITDLESKRKNIFLLQNVAILFNGKNILLLFLLFQKKMFHWIIDASKMKPCVFMIL